MAEMTSLDVSILEAAKVDGATEFQTTIRIILPLMKNIIGTTTVLGATSMLQKLDILMMTTKGGPGDVTLNLPYFRLQYRFLSKAVRPCQLCGRADDYYGTYRCRNHQPDLQNWKTG